MSNFCLIQQEAGLGDILFCQNHVKFYSEKNYKVIWPIVPPLLNICNQLITDAKFYNAEEDYPLKSFFEESYMQGKIIENNSNIFIPMKYASYIIPPYIPGKKEMQSKHILCGLDYTVWKTNLNFHRNLEKENILYYDILKLKDNEDFILINQTYSTQPTTIKKDLSPFKYRFGDSKFIEMSILEGFTIFDWCKVFENMKSIITVDTSLMYIIEKLDLKNKTDFLCITRSLNTEEDIKELFTYPWTYIHA
jgi:hypothetical protein